MSAKSTTEPELKPCRCGRRALIERFHDGDDSQPLFVATCEVCPVKTYDQFTADEAARVWNEFVSGTVNIPDGQWQHVHIRAGNPRVVAIQFETAEQATAFINSFAASPASAAPVVDKMWEALKAECCKNPAEAKLAVFVSEKKFKEALAPFAAAAATVAPQETSSDTWSKWFERLGEKATAEIVNATADLVTDERLAALVDAKVLPAAAPVEQKG